MISDSLSNIELYFTSSENIKNNDLTITGEEAQHITKVMRHQTDDILFVTDGKGKIFESKIESLYKDKVYCNILNSNFSENKLSYFTFCLPKLKNPDRFEFALEKCVELGITNIIVFDAVRSISKSEKLERWNKILLSAMKQSLRSYLPVITINSLDNLITAEGVKIFFEQNASEKFVDFQFEDSKNYYLIFGPEGGLSPEELSLAANYKTLKLNNNRLRSETAIVSAASMISLKA